MTKNMIQKYAAYKDSGVEWLGEIPSGWERLKLNRLIFFQEGPGLRNWQFKDEGVKVICVTNITPPIIDFSKMTKYISREEYLSKYKHFTVVKDDILLASSGASWGKVSIYESAEIVILNTSTIRLRSKNKSKINNSIISYLLVSNYVNLQIENLLTGSCQPNFGPTHLDKLYIVLPSLPEQTAIAAFLDRKTALIDQAIGIKQKQIELLKERRQILIHKAVTRGLNPNVKMKDSGVEWIGEIPEGWEVKKVKHISNVVLGKMLCNEDKGNYQLKPYLKSKNIQWLNVDVSSVDEMWFSKKEILDYRLKKGDLVLSEGGEVGKTCIWNDELEECYIQNSAHKITFHANNSQVYYLYLLFTAGKIGLFEKIVNRVSIGHLTKDKLINTEVIQPPLEEQIAISNWIESASNKIDTAISLKEQEIEKLKEYKATLINSAVTGKIKVC